MKKIFFALFAVILVHSQAMAKDKKSSFSPEQKEEIGEIVNSYIIDHPEVLLQAIQKMQTDKKKSVLDDNRAKLEKNPNDPVMGNPKGNVTLVEFYDYNCGYCRKMFKTVADLVEDDGNIRWVMKELPSLAPSSKIASEAALAANKQGKFAEFHKALMGHKGVLTEDVIDDTAKSVGLDMKKYKKDKASKEIANIISDSLELATNIQVEGIPTFVVGDETKSGALVTSELRELIDMARSKK